MHIHKVVYLESSHSLVAKVKAAKFPVYQHAVVGVGSSSSSSRNLVTRMAGEFIAVSVQSCSRPRFPFPG